MKFRQLLAYCRYINIGQFLNNKELSMGMPKIDWSNLEIMSPWHSLSTREKNVCLCYVLYCNLITSDHSMYVY